VSDTTSMDEATGLLNRPAFLKEVRNTQASLPQHVRQGCLLLLYFPVVRAIYLEGGEAAANDALKHLLAIIETRLRSRDTLGRVGLHSLCIFLRQCREEDALIVADQHAALLRDVVINVAGKTVPLELAYRIVPLDHRGERLTQGISQRVAARKIDDVPTLEKTISVAGNTVDLTASRVVSLNAVQKECSPAPVEALAPVVNIAPSSGVHTALSWRLRPGLLIRRKSHICCLRLQKVGVNNSDVQLQDSIVMASVMKALALNTTKNRPVVESQLILPVCARQINPQFPEWVSEHCQKMRVAPSDICLSIAVSSLSEELRAMAPILRDLNRAGIRLMIEDIGSAAEFRMMQNLAIFDFLYLSGKTLLGCQSNLSERQEVETLIAETKHQHAEVCCSGIDSQTLLDLALDMKIDIGFGRQCAQSVQFPKEAWTG